MATEQKVCASCGRLRPVTEFNSHAAHKDGLDTRCKECSRQSWNKGNARLRKQRRETPLSFRPNLTDME